MLASSSCRWPARTAADAASAVLRILHVRLGGCLDILCRLQRCLRGVNLSVSHRLRRGERLVAANVRPPYAGLLLLQLLDFGLVFLDRYPQLLDRVSLRAGLKVVEFGLLALVGEVREGRLSPQRLQRIRVERKFGQHIALVYRLT
jgi:hypothetical protein